jgi:indole-3-glycerol phosphate synthase
MSDQSLYSDLPATLREIVEFKREEVARAKSRNPRSELIARCRDLDPTRDFVGSLLSRASTGSTAVIAEVKRRSPSAGLIRSEYDGIGFDPSVIAQQYSKAGASAISCLTDEKFFGGDPRFVQRIRERVDLPVLRKDFMIDPYQVHEARAMGADAILLIAECLTDEQIAEMLDLASELSMGTLLESHDPSNLDRMLRLVEAVDHGRYLIGINNRDLRTMTTDLAHTTDLVDRVPDRSLLVSESGIRTASDLAMLRAHGVGIVLVGEHLMRQEAPGAALEELLG